MLQQLQNQFRSITKSLDVLYVLEGIKLSSRIMVYEDELRNALTFFENKNINIAISDFKVLKQNLQSKFYSDKSIKVDKNDNRKGYFFLYISKNDPEKAKDAENKNDHLEFGRELGYPKCCCKFFNENFDIESKLYNDYTLATLRNSDGYEFPFYTNIAVRHFDINLLSYFPCHFNCDKSIKIAKNNLEIIKRHSTDLAGIFEKTLNGAVLYTKTNGIFILKNIQKINKNIEVMFNNILTTTTNHLFELLQSNKKLTIINKNKIRINGILIEGQDIGFMIFH